MVIICAYAGTSYMVLSNNLRREHLIFDCDQSSKLVRVMLAPIIPSAPVTPAMMYPSDVIAPYSTG